MLRLIHDGHTKYPEHETLGTDGSVVKPAGHRSDNSEEAAFDCACLLASATLGGGHETMLDCEVELTVT